MLIKAAELDSIKQYKVTFIKNFASLTRQYDFNLLSELMEENDCLINTKYDHVSNFLQEFKTFFDFLSKLFKYKKDANDEVDLFFSLVSQVGNSHFDKEDVFIIGLKGTTIYRVFDKEKKDYTIEKGDMVFIPRGIKHKVIGLNPRIIASVGFYGKRIGDG